jgi:hypothetical protein
LDSRAVKSAAETRLRCRLRAVVHKGEDRRQE